MTGRRRTDSPRAPRRSIARRYAVHVGVISGSLLLASSGLEMLFGYREARQQIAGVQAVQAEAAAREITQYLRNIEDGLRDTAKLPWGDRAFGWQQKREEFYRLMVLFPAIVELQEVDAGGRETLYVSRSEADRIDSGAPPAEPALLNATVEAPHYGATFYREGAEPYVRLVAPHVARTRSWTVATLNLRFLGEVVSGLKVGENGRIFVVDASNRLIAHPRATHVLRQLDLTQFAPVQVARSRSGPAPLLAAEDHDDLEGRPVIVTARQLQSPDWMVFVEQPRSEALEPALATLTRTLLLIAVGGVLALAASMLFSRRMAAPIIRLRQATRRIAAGDLAHRIELDTGDEIEQLGDDFNRMARQLLESYRGLEAKVTQRTAELAVRKEEAERANAAKTRFLAAASHDLRQPMHSISLLVSVLRDRLVDPQQAVLADKVLLSVAVMEHLFSSLLDISKLDAGAVHPDVQPIAVDSVLAQLAHAYGPLAAARGLSLTVARCRGVVRSDAAMLERILGNLVANAIRYTRRGGVLVGCRRRGAALCIQVVDTGIGIPATHLDDIFDEFFRLDGLSLDEEKGLGLGLSIVKRSAEILGHPLRVHSVQGRGSTFEIEVPRVDNLPSQQAMPLLDGVDRSALSGAFVMVIDDDERNRDALDALCVHWGCSVLAVASVDDGVRQLAQHLRAPDLLITDFRIAQGHDGVDAIERIRALTLEAIPAIVVTADVASGLQQRVAAAGAVLLHKPVGADRLLRAVSAALRSREDAAATADRSAAPACPPQ
ncbi:hybrid sensor histidine kinase/response regulator [Rhizobacter sp. P5_C2]